MEGCKNLARIKQIDQDRYLYLIKDIDTKKIAVFYFSKNVELCLALVDSLDTETIELKDKETYVWLNLAIKFREVDAMGEINRIFETAELSLAPSILHESPFKMCYTNFDWANEWILESKEERKRIHERNDIRSISCFSRPCLEYPINYMEMNKDEEEVTDGYRQMVKIWNRLNVIT